MVLILVRHGKSLWNKQNRFTGFKDIELCDDGIVEAKNCASIIKRKGLIIDHCFTSDLKRAIHTSEIIKEENYGHYSIVKSKFLKERDYGELTGLNKNQVKEIYGEKQVQKWRRSYFN